MDGDKPPKGYYVEGFNNFQGWTWGMGGPDDDDVELSREAALVQVWDHANHQRAIGVRMVAAWFETLMDEGALTYAREIRGMADEIERRSSWEATE